MEALIAEDVQEIRDSDNTVWTCTACGHKNDCRNAYGGKEQCDNCGADLPIKTVRCGNTIVSFHGAHDLMLEIEGKLRRTRYLMEELEEEVEAVHGFLRANVELDTYRRGLDLGD